jgi:radical SAM protein with 4Fe4S-binding SPASM domain
MNVLYPLSELTVEITWQCLQNCIHCSSGASINAQESLSKDEVINVANDFKELGGKKIELSGGEPFLHTDISDLLLELKKMNLAVNVFTCGVISKESDWTGTMQRTVELVKERGVDKVVFSLHGANAGTHDDIVKSKGSFSQAVEFMRELVKEKVCVGIHFVPMTLNFEEFRDLVDFAVDIGVHDLNVLRFVPQGRGEKNKESLMLNKLEVARLVELLAEEKKKRKVVKVGSHLDFTFLIDGSVPKPCAAGVTKCLVEANGNIIPCAVFKGMTDKEKNNFVAGNIRKEHLSDVWRQSTIFDKFRKFDPKELQGGCRLCDYLSKCKGRCPAQRIYDHGDFYIGPDNYCPKEFFDKKIIGHDCK